MRQPIIPAMALAVILQVAAAAAQSLSAAARKEQERRSSLTGVDEKKIEGQDGTALAPEGNLSRFSPVRRPTKERNEGAGAKSADRRTLAQIRASVQKLDREIRQAEDRLRLLRSRDEAQRKAAQTASSRSASQDRPRQDSRWQIQELEMKLARLREERAAVYDSGRKAGFLPGELDGKGIIP